MSDLVLEAWVSGLVESARLRGTPKSQDSWTPGKQLKLLIAGYNGARKPVKKFASRRSFANSGGFSERTMCNCRC